MRVAVETHGCRLNQAESEAMAAALRARGHELVRAVEDADLYLLNSCAITHEADADARAALRRAKRRNPGLEVVVTGCYANAEPERLQAMAEVDAVLGNLEKQHDLGPVLEGLLTRRDRGPLVAVSALSRKLRPQPWSLTPAVDPGRTRPLLKIQDGCDYQCSFCIVPSVRGRSRSLSAEALVEQLRALVQAGHPEVVLTGVHLGLWGRDLPARAGEDQSLGSLVATLRREVPGARLRLGSVDPHEVDETLIAALAVGIDDVGAGLCRHLHLPIQSGDDQVLRAMRRAHRVADLEELLPRLRALAPDIAVGTDVIVGFPGESDAAFERTRALFETLGIPLAHVFCWSPRAGTAAVDLPERVASEVATARSKALREVVAASWRRHVETLVGREQSAVVLRRRSRGGDLVALTEGYLKLRVAGPDAALGRRVRVRLDEISAGRVRGTLIPS